MGLRPMLCGKIDPKQLPRYCQNDQWWFEQKLDGHRKLILIDGGKVTPIGRDGQATTLPAPAVTTLSRLPGRWVLDCELLDAVLWPFDILEAPRSFASVLVDDLDRELRPSDPYHQRRQVLDGIQAALEGGTGGRLRVLPSARTEYDKALLAKRLLDNNCEGVILKNKNAPYKPGIRSNDCLKAKFRHDIDCVVTRLRVGGKDNIEVAVFEPGNPKPVVIGEVTALAGDGARVKVDDVVCVKYLYAMREQRRLVQPTLPRIRTDKAAYECTIDQLVFTSKEVLV